MKKLLLLLAFLSFSSALYDDPPLASVATSNRATASSILFNHFNESIAKSVSIHAVGNIIYSNASMRIAGLTLVVDNATSPGLNTGVIIEKGGVTGHLMQKSGIGRCDRTFFERYGDNAECDFDNDGCSEYENSTDIFYTINVTFFFRDSSTTEKVNEETVRIFDKTFGNAVTNVISIPALIEQVMENSSGIENLSVVLNGTATAVYDIVDRENAGVGCIDSHTVVFDSMGFSDMAIYRVEGKNKFFFLSAPILNEQWFRNNQFDNVVLSQSRMYKVEIVKNDEKVKNFTLYRFNTTTNGFGLLEIVSVPAEDISTFIGTVNITPSHLDSDNHTYAFLYRFNYSYDGIGDNILALLVKDVFGRSENYTQKIKSRQLSYDSNKTETGNDYNAATTRKSASLSIENLRMLEIGFGMLGVLVILIAYRTRK